MRLPPGERTGGGGGRATDITTRAERAALRVIKYRAASPVRFVPREAAPAALSGTKYRGSRLISFDHQPRPRLGSANAGRETHDSSRGEDMFDLIRVIRCSSVNRLTAALNDNCHSESRA